MSLLARLIVLLIAAAIVVQAFVLWAATGRAAFTRYHDPAREVRSEHEPDIADLFADTGLEDDHRPMEDLPNRFTLGLLPSGPDHHIVSVLTLAGPAGLAAIAALLPYRRRDRAVDSSL